MILRARRRTDQFRRHGDSAISLGQQRSRQRLDLRIREIECWHFERRAERTRVANLAGDIVGQRLRHAAQEAYLEERLAPDAREVRGKAFWWGHAVDSVTRCASIVADQLFPMGDAGSVGLGQT